MTLKVEFGLVMVEVARTTEMDDLFDHDVQTTILFGKSRADRVICCPASILCQSYPTSSWLVSAKFCLIHES